VLCESDVESVRLSQALGDFERRLLVEPQRGLAEGLAARGDCRIQPAILWVEGWRSGGAAGSGVGSPASAFDACADCKQGEAEEQRAEQAERDLDDLAAGTQAGLRWA
jgi:hypothetical protein